MDPLLIRAIRNEEVERPPVWMMRQAGRYLAEYREVKEKHGFLGMCKSPELAAEITLQPISILDVDAAILFSDIMIPVGPMGLEIDFAPGPKIANPIRNSSDVENLKIPDLQQHVGFVFEAIKLIRHKLDLSKALIGFAGAPWTLACYIIDQGLFKHFHGTQVFAKQQHKAMAMLLDKLASVIAEYLVAQVESGADVVQIFDSWGGNLSESDYSRYSLPYIQRIIEQVKKTGCPVTLFVGNCSHLLHALKNSGADCISLDWRSSFSEAREIFGDQIVVQGNFDPAHLFASVDEVRLLTRKMLSSWPVRSGYIVNLGHGVLINTPRENALAFVDEAKKGWTT